MKLDDRSTKKTLIILLSLFLIVIFSSSVYSIGITVPSEKQFYFEPNLELKIPYYIINNGKSQYIDVSVEGSLAEYGSVSENSFWVAAGDKHYVEFYIGLPESLEPGVHEIAIVATEAISDESSISARTAVRGRITIFSPYPDDYAILTPKTYYHMEKNNPCNFEVSVNNYGSNNLIVNFDSIKIYDHLDLSNPVLNVIPNPRQQSTISKSQRNIEFLVPECTELEPGIYKVKFDYSFTDEHKSAATQLKVGSFDINIINYTDSLYVDEINKLQLRLGSMWNEAIHNVVLKVTIYDDSGNEITYSETSLFSIGAWETINKILFIDSPEEPGKYNSKILLSYSDEEQGPKSLEKNFVLSVENKKFDVEKYIDDNSGTLIIVSACIILLMGLYIVKSKKYNFNPNSKKTKKVKARKKRR